VSDDHERSMLRDSVRTLLRRHWPADKAMDLASKPAELTKIWHILTDQGLAGLGKALSTEDTSGGLEDALAVMMELGRNACPSPLRDAVLLNLVAGKIGERQLPILDDLHAGKAYPSLSFGAQDPDRSVGSIKLASGKASGKIHFAEGGQCATHFVIFESSGNLVVIEATNAEVKPTRALGADGLFQVEFADAPATMIALPAGLAADLLSVSRLCYAARAWGAANRSFELVVDYVKERKQFGQPVGRFQALQHKLANNLIALSAIRLSLENAAAHFDRGVDHWRTFASAAFAYANATLRQVAMENHHAFGAIGYAEDHEAPRHFKQVHLDIVRHGGGKKAREELASTYLGDKPVQVPEFNLGEAGNKFRLEVREWLAKHWPPERAKAYRASDKTHRDFDRDFALEMGKTGWIGLAWPKKFGGMERSPFELLAFIEEMNRAEAPRVGAPIQANSWMVHGRPDQQARYLPELLRGEVVYGMWYSEPNSGSDLASLRTKAVLDGDQWVINGEKIWTTTYWGDYMWLAARTDPDAKPHAGISMFIVPTNTPGITRRPIKTMYDGEFCNTFFDNVRISKDAIVGEVNRGWEILTGSLGTERAFVGPYFIAKVAHMFESLCDYVRTAEVDGKPLRLDPIVRDTIGSYAAQLEAGRQLALQPVTMLSKGIEPTWEGSLAKVFSGELMERLSEAGLDILGMSATLSAGNPDAPLRGHLEQKLRHSLMYVISVGTNEIQRSLIAQRGLGLPR